MLALDAKLAKKIGEHHQIAVEASLRDNEQLSQMPSLHPTRQTGPYVAKGGLAQIYEEISTKQRGCQKASVGVDPWGA